MLISVLMAVKNGERFIAAAIDSVLAQGHDAIEILVVDGGSTDRSQAIARACPAVRWLAQDGAGFADAWNQGLLAAGGPLIAMLDADDLWTPGKLDAQLALLAARPELGAVIGQVQFVLEPGCPLPPGFRPELLDAPRMAPMPGTLLARREVFDELGPFATEMSVASDIEWFARLKESRFEVGEIDRVLLRKRVHDANVSYFQARALNREILGLLRDSVDRRRRAAQ